MQNITLEWVKSYANQLFQFSNITESDIRDIWIKDNEEYLEDFSNLKYDYSIPLYQKMIFRFRNGGNLATRLYDGRDPGNKRRLTSYFGLHQSNRIPVRRIISGLQIHHDELIEFMSWIANGLGVHDIAELKKVGVSKSQYIDSWRKNQIEFFFSLSEADQQSLIERYNLTCIAPMNDMNDMMR